jgi:hypothetical protein
MRKKLFLACKAVNNLRLTNKIEFHGRIPDEIIPDFIEALEDIDDQGTVASGGPITRVPIKIIELYERLIDESDSEVLELYEDTRPLYDKSHGKNRNRRTSRTATTQIHYRNNVVQHLLRRKLDI